MDSLKRYQVFVSSTYLDLRDERQAVIAALLECDAFPAGMEVFPAADDDAWSLIKRVVDESDYYLLVIGGKYGSIDPDEDLSFTEMEYDYACSCGKPVLAFLHGSPGDLTVNKSEDSPKRRQKLDKFREKVQANKHVKFWTSSDQLAGQVALSFNKFVRLYPAVGWIRADQITSAESMREMAESRRRIAELESRLERSRVDPPADTTDLSQGDDPARIAVSARFQYRSTSNTTRNVSRWVYLSPTWNEIFSAVCPKLLDEAEENVLREALQDWIRIDHFDSVDEVMKARLDELGQSEQFSTIRQVELTIDDEDLGNIIIQFLALGLIQKSARKRSLSSTGTYWTLTPYGATRAVQLRAKRRGLQGREVEDREPAAEDTEELSEVVLASGAARSEARTRAVAERSEALDLVEADSATHRPLEGRPSI